MNSKILLDNLNLLSNEVSTIQHLKNLIIDLAVTGRFSRGMFESELGSEVISNSIEKSNSKTIKSLDESLSYCDIPNHWSWSNTEILCHTQTGATPDKSGSIDESSITYITSADIQGFRAHSENKVSRLLEGKKLRIAPAGSILFVGIGDVGRCGVTEIESTFNQQIHSATPYVTNPKFLCLFYSSTFFRNQIELLSSATTLTILNKSKWSSIPVPVPSLIEQQWIVEKAEELLGVCDELEAKLDIRKLVETASRNSVIDAVSRAQSPEELQIAWKRIEDNWEVVTSDPESIESLRNLILSLAISGNLTKGFISKDYVKELLDNVGKRINPYPEMSDERFAIPTHWKWVPLASIAEHQLGKMLQTSQRDGIRTKYLRTANLKSDGSIDLSNLKEMFIPESEISKYSVLKGDIFINEGGEVGRSAIFQDASHPNLAFQNHLHRLRVAQGIENQYIQIVLKQAKSHGVIASMSSGVTIQNFSANSLRRLAIPLPPQSEQKLIVEKVNQLVEICNELEIGMTRRNHIAEKFARSVVSTSA